jgi:hypothetical protein
MYDSLVKKCSQFSFLGLRNGINSQKRRTYAFIIKRSLALSNILQGASHFCNKQLYLDAKYLYGKPFREFIDFQRFSKLCDWNQNRYYKSLLTLLSIYTHYIIGMLPILHRTNQLIVKALLCKAFRCLRHECIEILVLTFAILGVICPDQGWTDLTI